jgi:hypothetical protein
LDEAEVDAHGAPELERRFEPLQARGVELDLEISTSPEQADGQQERRVAAGEGERHRRRPTPEGNVDDDVHDDVPEGEHPGRSLGHIQVVRG